MIQPVSVDNLKAYADEVASDWGELPPPPVAFAVHCADDKTLNFYKRADVPAIGDTFDGRTVTAVYSDLESITNLSGVGDHPWYSAWKSIKIINIIDEGIQPLTCAGWFSGNPITTINGLEKLDTSRVTSMRYMFSNSSVTSLDLSSFDTSNVTNMSGMFDGCYKLTTLNLSNFNTSKVTNMSHMFRGVNQNILQFDISNFDTSNVTDMSQMFKSCGISVLNLSTFDTSSLDTTQSMFEDSHAVKIDLSNFNADKLTFATKMFYNNTVALTTIKMPANLKFPIIKNMDSMFQNCPYVTLDCSNWTINPSCMFHNSFNTNSPNIIPPTFTI